MPLHSRWLAAISLPCADKAAVGEVRGFIASYASVRQLHVFVNVFDGHADTCRGALLSAAGGSGASGASSSAAASSAKHSSRLVTLSTTPGHKTIFWKRDLTPSVIAKFDFVWLMDCDVRVSPHLFSLSEAP